MKDLINSIMSAFVAIIIIILMGAILGGVISLCYMGISEAFLLPSIPFYAFWGLGTLLLILKSVFNKRGD